MFTLDQSAGTDLTNVREFEPLGSDQPTGTDSREARRLLQSAAVRKYMEGGALHPGFLLPWEELREDCDGFYYFVDLVTEEITYREEKKRGSKKTRLYDRPEVLGFPPTLYFAPHAEKELYLRRRSFYVEYWRHYLGQRKAFT